MSGIKMAWPLCQIPRVQRYQSQLTVGAIATHRSASQTQGKRRSHRPEGIRDVVLSFASVTSLSSGSIWRRPSRDQCSQRSATRLLDRTEALPILERVMSCLRTRQSLRLGPQISPTCSSPGRPHRLAPSRIAYEARQQVVPCSICENLAPGLRCATALPEPSGADL